MSILAHFDGFHFRTPNTLADLERLSDWIEMDQAHQGIYTPDYFMGGKFSTDPRSTYLVLEDVDGEVFYVRISRAARVRIQFSPDTSEPQRSRNLRGLLHGMAFLEAEISRQGVEEWIFDTENPELKKAAEKILGFTESTHEMVRAIADPLRKLEVV